MKALPILLFALIGVGLAADAQFPATPANPTVAERIAFAKAICPAGPRVEGESVICDRCPEDLDVASNWSLGAVYKGHFTSRADENALVELMGCGQNPRNRAATALLSRRQGAWKLVELWNEQMTQACHNLRAPAGYEILVCANGSAWMGVIAESICAFDFRTTNRGEQPCLATVTDNTGMGCLARELSRGHIDEVKFGRIQPDGSTEISITITEGRMVMTAQQQERCQAEAAARNEAETPPGLELHTRTLRYRYDGKFHLLM